MKQTLYVLLGMLLLSTMACNKTKTLENTNLAELDNKFKDYVTAYTSGVLSRGASIRVQFISDIATEAQIGKTLENTLFQISPAIEGSMVWETPRTLVFTPTNWLPAKQAYQISIDMRKIYPNIPNDLQTFAFPIRVQAQAVALNIRGLRELDMANPNMFRLVGKVHTIDIAKPEEVQKILTYRQAGNDSLTIKWEHSGDLREHSFEILNIRRAQDAAQAQLQLDWDGSALGSSSKGSEKIEVPNNTFKILTHKVISEGKTSYLLATFSHILAPQQQLPNEIKMGRYGTNVTYNIEGNELHVIPNYISGKEFELELPAILASIEGNTLQAPVNIKGAFEETNPGLRNVSKGVIIPNNEGLYFPFEAVNLYAIDVEILKVYQNNVFAFLQDNDLDDSYGYRSVGRIVLQKRIVLQDLKPDANVGQWTRYALKLDDFIKQEEGAIYQIRLGFRKEYSALSCANPDGYSALALQKTTSVFQKDEEGEYISIMDSRDYDYDYDKQKDPCFEQYYRYDRFIRQNIVASNLGIVAKRGKDKELFLAVTDLLTAQPVAGAELEVLDAFQQRLAKVSTDAQGIVRTKTDKYPFLIVASAKSQKGYLRLKEGESLSLSSFRTDGAINHKGLKGNLYGERGVWRPGDSLYLTFALEDKQKNLPAHYPVTLELYDPNGTLRYTRTSADHVKGLFPFRLATAPDAPTGKWQAQVLVGGATFYEEVLIETVKPNRLKIKFNLGKEVLLAKDKNLAGTLQVNWLAGTPASGLRTEVNVDLNPIATQFEKYKNFIFDDPARNYLAEPFTLFDSEVDEKGYADVNGSFQLAAPPAGKMNAAFTIRAYEDGGEFSSDNFTIPFSPYAAYIGIETQTDKEFAVDKNNEVKLVALSELGQPLANRALSVGIYKLSWQWWWEDGGEDEARRFNSAKHLGATQSFTATSGANGTATINVKTKEWGRYLVRVCDDSSGHCTGTFIYAGNPYEYGENEYGFDNQEATESASTLNLTTDKSTYKTGENIELTIPATKQGKALITIENAYRVISHQWVDVGTDKSGLQKVNVKTVSEMSPNAYIYVTLLQPHNQVENDLPMRLYGVTPVQVEDPATVLEPTLDMPKELKPNSIVKIKVGEKQKRAMAYTLAIVDEGLLDLTRFKTPELHSSFYQKEALGVHTWDLYKYVLGKYGVDASRVLGIGGDAFRGADDARKANRFKPMVRFIGPFFLEAGKTATHEIEIPNYMGSVRTMLVAAHEGAYGSTDKTTFVRQPLMALATAPRILAPTEQFAVPVTVFATDKAVKNVEVEIKTNDVVEVVGNSKTTVSFSDIGDEVVYFNVQSKNKMGLAKISVTAKSGSQNAKYDIELQVRNPNAPTTKITEIVVEPGKPYEQTLTPFGTIGTNNAVLEVSTLPAINLQKRLAYLIQYPHGCIEQTTSGAFPQLYVGILTPLTPAQKQSTEANIRAAITKIGTFQNSEGGFTYWSGGGGEASDWGSTYAGHFLVEAKNMGYNVSDKVLASWKKYQKNAARNWYPSNNKSLFSSEALAQSYRLYTLALAQAAELGEMNELLNYREKLPVAAKWRLAATYALIGKEAAAEQLIAQLPVEVPEYRELSYTYGSPLRDEAMILETLIALGDKADAAAVLKKIAAKLGSDEWLSTQETAYTLLAISKFVQKTPNATDATFVYQFGAGTLRSENIGKQPIVRLPIELEGQETTKIMFQNKSQQTLFVRLIQEGTPPVGASTNIANNMKMDIKYETVEGATINPASIEQGTDFVAIVTVSNPGKRGNYEELALTQLFPSGWEIINSRMNAAFNNNDAKSVFEYQDVRDDRVNTYFDMKASQTLTYRIYLNAAYKGKFYLPPTQCEAMYDNSISASKGGSWVEVIAQTF